MSSIADTYRRPWEAIHADAALQPVFRPPFELHDERFKGPMHPATEIGIYIPVCVGQSAG